MIAKNTLFTNLKPVSRRTHIVESISGFAIDRSI